MHVGSRTLVDPDQGNYAVNPQLTAIGIDAEEHLP
jgi:hypothetical protein